jgi:hypothetical protein
MLTTPCFQSYPDQPALQILVATRYGRASQPDSEYQKSLACIKILVQAGADPTIVLRPHESPLVESFGGTMPDFLDSTVCSLVLTTLPHAHET